MSSVHLLVRRSAVTAGACFIASSAILDHQTLDDDTCKNRINNNQERKHQLVNFLSSHFSLHTTKCEISPNIKAEITPSSQLHHKNKQVDQKDDENNTEEMYHDLFPQRQLWKPKMEYPLWDNDWDGRDITLTGDKEVDKERERNIRKNGVTRHIILVRHGQYDETHKEDEKRLLTPLGREQADLTGRRLAEMINGINEQFGPCNVTTIRVSNLARAKETADIIARHLPDTVVRADPDPNLNEGRPCHHIPGRKANKKVIESTEEGHQRIEKAFETYFYRSEEVRNETDGENNKDGKEKSLKFHHQHEFEIIVCHANVIRYFLCRALQIPPEAWLRFCTFNCSLNYLTIRPSGSVSCRMIGDIGHLGLAKSTFSMHHGFNW